MFTYNGNESYYEGIDGKVTTNNVNGSSTASTTTTTTSNNISTPVNTPTSVPNDKINIVTTNSSNDKKSATSTSTSNSPSSSPSNNTDSKSIEGFDLQATENSILRGKQSNSIPVSQYNNQSTEVAPYEGPSFSNFFGLFNSMM
jgi:hypothetical protein